MDLTGFMFGNVNEEGELDNDGVLDRVSLLVSLTILYASGDRFIFYINYMCIIFLQLLNAPILYIYHNQNVYNKLLM